MDKKPIFYEVQQFRQWWVWALLIIVTIASTGSLIVGYIKEPSFPVAVILLPLLPFVIVTFLFWKAALITRVEEDGIYVKFTYFHKNFKFYPWDTIAYCEVKKYNPAMDYGGWGIKPGAYNISGNMGMLIQFTRRDNLMIGTNKPEELKTALINLGKLK
jgi:hypothetical protein